MVEGVLSDQHLCGKGEKQEWAEEEEADCDLVSQSHMELRSRGGPEWMQGAGAFILASASYWMQAAPGKMRPWVRRLSAAGSNLWRETRGAVFPNCFAYSSIIEN